jgi:hypothetical protein
MHYSLHVALQPALAVKISQQQGVFMSSISFVSNEHQLFILTHVRVLIACSHQTNPPCQNFLAARYGSEDSFCFSLININPLFLHLRDHAHHM